MTLPKSSQTHFEKQKPRRERRNALDGRGS